jgi:crotonobetainyl-CoA:carnitine CoA-transferase CaiB-like acyl-CoA transferase
MAGALDGIRVIDFGQWLAGPLTALLVEAGLGAHTLGNVTQRMQDPWAIAQGLSVTRRRDGAMLTTIGPPVRLSRTPAVPGRPVSPPGGDAAEVLAMTWHGR